MADRTPHDAHVAAGYCPAIADTKAWCNARASERPHHRHRAPLLLGPDGPTRMLYWTDEDRTPRG